MCLTSPHHCALPLLISQFQYLPVTYLEIAAIQLHSIMVNKITVFQVDISPIIIFKVTAFIRACCMDLSTVGKIVY